MQTKQSNGCLISCKGDVNKIKQRLLNILKRRCKKTMVCLIFCKGDVNKTKQNNGCLIFCKGPLFCFVYISFTKY